MIVLAITGGIGSGKSTVRNWFQQQGIPTLDADQIGKQLVAKNQPGLLKIVETFGEEVLYANGELNRETLRQRVFNDPQQKAQLEAILHPMIRQQTQQLLKELPQQDTPLAVVEIPLLAETGQPEYINKVLVTDCDRKTQLERTLSRGRLSADEVKTIIDQQASRQQRLALADYVIDTDQSLDSMQQNLQQLLREINKIERN